MVLVCKVKLSGAVQRQSESRVQTSLPQAEREVPGGCLEGTRSAALAASFLQGWQLTKPDYEIVQRLV